MAVIYGRAHGMRVCMLYLLKKRYARQINVIHGVCIRVCKSFCLAAARGSLVPALRTCSQRELRSGALKMYVTDSASIAERHSFARLRFASSIGSALLCVLCGDRGDRLEFRNAHIHQHSTRWFLLMLALNIRLARAHSLAQG